MFVRVMTQFIQITISLLSKILATLFISQQTVRDNNQLQLSLTQEGCGMAFSITSYNYT